MKKFLRSFGGIDIYEVEDIDSLWPEDLVVPEKTTAICAYYMVAQYPRFRVAFSDDLRIDESSAATAACDFISWWCDDAQCDVKDIAVMIIAHDNLSDDDFKALELEALSKPFMKSHDCDFIAHARGEFSVD